MILKRKEKNLNKRLGKKISRLFPGMHYSVMIFDGSQEYSNVRYVSNAPKKRVHQIMKALFKEWRQKHLV